MRIMNRPFGCSVLSYVLCFCFFLTLFTGAISQPLGYYCPNTTTYAANSTYRANLNILLSTLSSNSTRGNGFYNSTVGGGNVSDPAVYGLFMCRGDVSTADCAVCVSNASETIVKLCPKEKTAIVWDTYCMLRYSNVSIFGRADQTVSLSLYNTQSDPQPARFTQAVGNTLEQMVMAAGGGDRSGRKFATGERNVTESERIYSLGQCTPDISDSDCQRCLRSAIKGLESCCFPSLGARTLFPSCNVRYEVYPFYNGTAALASPPVPVPAPAPAPVPALKDGPSRMAAPPTSPPGEGNRKSSSSRVNVANWIILMNWLVIGCKCTL